jgi:hypothetical protein
MDKLKLLRNQHQIKDYNRSWKDFTTYRAVLWNDREIIKKIFKKSSEIYAEYQRINEPKNEQIDNW